MAMEETLPTPRDLAGDEDDDVPSLSCHALAALQEFLREQPQEQQMNWVNGQAEVEQQQQQRFDMVKENWGMSQFWYDSATSQTLADELEHLCGLVGSNIACVSCPSLYVQLKNSCPGISVSLFEYDHRFARYGSDFTFYDYKYPEDLHSKYLHFFDIVVADPPYLSEECIEKMSQTLKLLSKNHEKFPILLLTGAVQQSYASRLLNLHPCSFRPVHHNKLGNEFRLYTNYNPLERLGGWEDRE